MSPNEILAAAQTMSPGVGQATVYRTIKAFLAQGWIESIELPGEPPRYEVAGKHHHHHFHCQTCDGVFEIAGCALKLEKGLPPGFKLENHEVVLYGTCDRCSTGRPAPGQPSATRPLAGIPRPGSRRRLKQTENALS
jgi:Fur family ferric uptake transcriptional regulator